MSSKIPYNIGKKSQQIPQKHTNIDPKTIKITEVIILTKKSRVTSNYNTKSPKKAVNCFNNYVSAKFVKTYLRNTVYYLSQNPQKLL